MLSSAWVTGQFTSPEVDRIAGHISELAARDQPWTRLFRSADALTGVACLAGVALVPRARREWPGWLAFAVLGGLLIMSGVFPLDCAVLSDPACEHSALSWSHHIHAVVGVLASVAVLAVMALFGLSWRTWPAWLLTGLSLGVTGLAIIATATGYLTGLAQRAQVALLAVWLVYVALRLLTADPPSSADGPAATDRGARPHVIEQGNGPAVLVSAGLAGAWFHWDRVAAELARSHRVIRFDRPGLGLSPASPTPLTLYGEAARLAALAPAHPHQVTVVAHSVAAWHAEAFARLHPMRVSKLVLVAPRPAGDGRCGTVLGQAFGRWLPVLGRTWGAAAVARLLGPAVHRLRTGLDDRDRVHGGGPVLAAVVGEWLACRGMAADLRAVRADHPMPDVPVTVISVGPKDPYGERLAGELDAKLVRLPGSGRHVELDDPGAIVDAV
ncbi:alpha/beta fold hydrolase [Nonomuraea cavernae]|uniref:alpha/beta fold hydrolase n=1 Tax=Nonomuraea cavernae TaxID=2045107 RepID=UPI00166E03A7|nr:alpha/beta fold hydrolase [Nonomuraea cavernae]MCA2188484.1 alpha/beta fold hydrolase [Nonomuraea cavernae]